MTASESRPAADGAAALIAEGEAALARGDAIAAGEAFDRAGAMRHAPDGEMGSVRAAMQLGDYARALAFAAHVAGEHLDEPGAAVLHAWLLRVGGQEAIADRVLREARARVPDDPIVAAAASAFASRLPTASDALLVPPHRTAPFTTTPTGEPAPPTGARVVSSGVLLPGGSHALAPRRTTTANVWIRDGLGATRLARLAASDDVSTLYRLDVAIAHAGGATEFGEPRAGMPAFLAQYAEGAAATPAWPWLRAGFLGASTRTGDGFRLGIDIPGERGGGPVLDRGGRIVGIALRDEGGRPTMRPASHWPGTDARVGSTAERPSTTDLPTDRVYERAMRTAVQVIAAA